MAVSTHTSKVFDQELRNLRDRVHLMGSLVEEMIAKGAAALSARDTALALATMRIDYRINRLEREVDELALCTLARRQPVASDLRYITAALKIVGYLKRIGDLCVNICESVIELNKDPPLPPVSDLSNFANQVITQVHDALDTLVTREVDQTKALLDRAAAIDDQYGQVLCQVVDLRAREPCATYQTTRVQAIAKCLARIADHAISISETVAFMVNGTDIRHYRSREVDSASRASRTLESAIADEHHR